MISVHSRSVDSCGRCGWAMVLCELAELAPHSRRWPAITTTQPIRRQRLFCLTWIALISCILPGGERGSSAKGRDPCCFHTSEIGPVAVLVQQQYVIDFSLENFATKIFRGKWNLLPVTAIDLSGFTRCEIANSAPDPAAGVGLDEGDGLRRFYSCDGSSRDACSIAAQRSGSAAGSCERRKLDRGRLEAARGRTLQIGTNCTSHRWELGLPHERLRARF
jgi:hypothetical protein